MQIQALSEATLAAAAAVWNSVVKDGMAFPQTDVLDADAARAFFAGQSFTGVALDGDAVAGLYILHPNNIGRCGHIANASYAVAKHRRGMHIGEALVRHSIAQAQAFGFRILQFNAVVASNAPALALYRKIGFTPLGTIPGGFRLDDGSYADIIPHWIDVTAGKTFCTRTERICRLGTPARNSWLLTRRGKHILIDTGYPEDWDAFCDGLTALHLTPDDIDFLFLTHAHDDHAGFVNRLLKGRAIRAVAAQKALPGLRRGQNGPGGGAPDTAAIAACMQMIREGHGAHRFPALTPEAEAHFLWVAPGQTADAEGLLDGKIVFLPGHTDDSIGLLTPAGALFCGDTAQDRPDTPMKTTIWIGDLPSYRKSWQQIIDLAPEQIYPGHGEPFAPTLLPAQLASLEDLVLLSMPRVHKKKN